MFTLNDEFSMNSIDMEHDEDETPEPDECLREVETSKTSAALTLVIFMASLLLVRWLMPNLVEEVHYAIERGKQRARYDVADERLTGDPLSGLSTASKLVAQRIAPSVVHIDTSRERLVDVSMTEERELHGQGSGVILSDDGEVLTNYHVIRGAEKITVTLSDDRQCEAIVVGVDDKLDLALLQLQDVADLIPAEWGDSDELDNGSMVWAAGSPFGLSKSTTFGIVSATGRNIDKDQEYLQSDAVVQAGNSGGPLVNSIGQVVGINTAIIGPSFQGVSFSIPSKVAMASYQRMLEAPQVPVGWLGVRLATPKAFGGAQIGLVMSGSPAEQAGIGTGDIITHWGEQRVDSPASLSELVRRTKIDEMVRVTVIRAASSSEEGINVKVGPKPLQF